MPSPKDRRGKLLERTLTRRTLLEWLGQATVLALGGEIIASCGTSPKQAVDTGGHGADASLDKWDPLSTRDGEGGEPGNPFAFHPGNGEAYPDWSERTVDPQDLASILTSWKLTVSGLVEAPQTFSFHDLLQLSRQSQITDFHCVEGWSVYDVPWDGVHLSQIFERVQPSGRASHVTFATIGHKYNESLPIDIALEPRTLLAYGVDGSTLPLKHGFPLRLVVPRLLAYKNAKFVEEIQLTDRPIEGFWVKAGYPYSGEVPQGRLREGKY